MGKRGISDDTSSLSLFGMGAAERVASGASIAERGSIDSVSALEIDHAFDAWNT